MSLSNDDYNAVKIGDSYFVDSNFLNSCEGAILHSSLHHVFMGDFMLKTPSGEIQFMRRSKEDHQSFTDFVGRPHYVCDNRDGELVKKLMVAMGVNL